MSKAPPRQDSVRHAPAMDDYEDVAAAPAGLTLTTLKERIDQLEATLTKEISDVRVQIKSVQDEQTALAQRVKAVEEGVSGIATVKGAVDALTNRVNSELPPVKDRLTKVEAVAAAATAAAAAVESKIPSPPKVNIMVPEHRFVSWNAGGKGGHYATTLITKGCVITGVDLKTGGCVDRLSGFVVKPVMNMAERPDTWVDAGKGGNGGNVAYARGPGPTYYIRGIRARCTNLVIALSFYYADLNTPGKGEWGPWHGREEGQVQEFMADENEAIVGFDTRSGSLLDGFAGVWVSQIVRVLVK